MAAGLWPLLLLLLPGGGIGWQRWPYEANTTEQWRAVWPLEYGPGERRGHSMVLYGTQILLFGGRSNEVKRRHVPMTYEIEDVDGVLEFVSYDQSSVLAGVCTETNGTTECDNAVDVGLYFNDVRPHGASDAP
jgi:hypothetical protein